MAKTCKNTRLTLNPPQPPVMARKPKRTGRTFFEKSCGEVQQMGKINSFMYQCFSASVATRSMASPNSAM
eukprot:369728-Rhodomonas_salina.1